MSPSQRTLFPRGASKKWTNAREPARSVAQVEKLRRRRSHFAAAKQFVHYRFTAQDKGTQTKQCRSVRFTHPGFYKAPFNSAQTGVIRVGPRFN